MAIGLDVPRPPEPDNPEEYDYETCPFLDDLSADGQLTVEGRSEERRVGKECRL